MAGRYGVISGVTKQCLMSLIPGMSATPPPLPPLPSLSPIMSSGVGYVSVRYLEGMNRCVLSVMSDSDLLLWQKYSDSQRIRSRSG